MGIVKIEIYVEKNGMSIMRFFGYTE